MDLLNHNLDPSKIQKPNIELGEQAISQLRLIRENDHTVIGQYLRIIISTKGCDGFSYDVGFSTQNEQDFLVTPLNDKDVQILVDPFTAFYSREMTIEFIQDFEEDREGFLVVNHHQKKYHGKFWKNDSTKVPPSMKSLSADSSTSL